MNEYWYLAWLALAIISVLGTLSLTSRSGWPLAVAVQHCSASAAGPPPLRGGPVTQTAPGVAGRTAGTAHPRLHQKPQYHAVVGRRRNHGCCINGRSRASQQAETHPRGAAALASGWYNFCLLINSWVDNQGFLMGWGIRWQQSVVVCNLYITATEWISNFVITLFFYNTGTFLYDFLLNFFYTVFFYNGLFLIKTFLYKNFYTEFF